MRPDWLAVDWGTSNLRVWAMQGEAILDHRTSDQGMGRLTRAEFEPALLALIGDWLGGGVMPIFACGMVGSRQGWFEAPYRAVPCTPLGADILAPTEDSRISVYIAPGLKQMTPADVMRGEETQIAGALAHMPDFDGVLCLPGTHSKWVRVSAGEVVSFRTFMTGELFALLSEKSVLAHAMGAGWDQAAFDQGLDDAISKPELIGARLFTLRAESLIANLGPDSARARLSGLLIGIELAASKPYWLGQRVALIGASKLTAQYVHALQGQGLAAQQLDATACTLAGLTAARKKVSA